MKNVILLIPSRACRTAFLRRSHNILYCGQEEEGEGYADLKTTIKIRDVQRNPHLNFEAGLKHLALR
jgi:hypothetical protein